MKSLLSFYACLLSSLLFSVSWSATNATKTNANVCKFPPETGLCRAFIRMYFYDPYEKACRIFIYGGCGGNGNRFNTYALCNSTCSKANVTPYPTTTTAASTLADVKNYVCLSMPDSGDCSQNDPFDFGEVRYFFNAQLGFCQPFTYCGTGGNENRFQNEIECLDFCMAVVTTTPKPTSAKPTWDNRKLSVTPTKSSTSKVSGASKFTKRTTTKTTTTKGAPTTLLPTTASSTLVTIWGPVSTSSLNGYQLLRLSCDGAMENSGYYMFASAENCADLCNNQRNCNIFTYNYNFGMCILSPVCPNQGYVYEDSSVQTWQRNQ